MGVIYSILPVNGETRDWLADMGCMVEGISSRSPSLVEIEDALSSLDGYRLEKDKKVVGSAWDVWIEGNTETTKEKWTRLTITSLSDGSKPQEFYFSKGSPELIFEVVAKITNWTGTLAVAPDGESAFLIPPQADLKKLFGEWLKQENQEAEQGGVANSDSAPVVPPSAPSE